jgi:bifunctional non-homologous end joining protein LigD
MLAVSSAMPRDQSDYSFEFKWDGMRVVLLAGDGGMRLETRNFKDVTRAFPELSPLGEALQGRSAVLDGEIVVLGGDGRPSFGGLQHRLGLVDEKAAASRAREAPVTYMLFDVLYMDGRDLTPLPLEERRRILEAQGFDGPAWRVPAAYHGEGDAMLEAARENGLEGVMAKRLGSAYLPGKRSRDWLKVKLVKSADFVVGGWVPLSTGMRGVGSLLLGYYSRTPAGRSESDAEGLVFAGKVGTGFTDRDREELAGLLEGLPAQDSPFERRTGEKGASYVEPVLVAEVEFRGWTEKGRLRQPSFKGLRRDKEAAEVFREDA